MSLIVKIMSTTDERPDGSSAHSLYGDVVSIHFPSPGETQVARLWVREPVKTALVPGFCENEKHVDLAGTVYVLNEQGKTISTFRPVLPAKNLRAALAEVRQSALDQGLMEGGQVSDEPTFQRYAGYEPLNIQR